MQFWEVVYLVCKNQTCHLKRVADLKFMSFKSENEVLRRSIAF